MQKQDRQQKSGEEEGNSVGILLDDALFSWASLEHMSKYQPSLQKATRILAPKKADAAQTAAASPGGSGLPVFDVGPLSLVLPVGGIVGIVGPVGCGKSTLIMGMLGELRNQQEHQRHHGCVEDDTGVGCGGDAPVGYLSQTPAILNGTLRQNVTLGMPYDAERYIAAIEAACLAPDIAAMPAGDMTEIGEVRSWLARALPYVCLGGRILSQLVACVYV